MTMQIERHVQGLIPVAMTGRVRKLVGLSAAVAGLPAPIGATCQIGRETGRPLIAEVVGFREDETLVLPYGELQGVRPGDPVALKQSVPVVRVGRGLLGRVLDARGRVLDRQAPPRLPHRVLLHGQPSSALDRPRISQAFETGVRVIDGLLTCGCGQRMGVFSGSGVGKSTLLGQLARSSVADVNVIVLVGERGREVREFLERDLGPEGLGRSVVVVATGDESAVLRRRAAHMGSAIAEYFRDQGANVLLLMDSVTRFAAAEREIGLAAGEPPATRGYPPSVFAALPRLLERSGRTARGSITGIYTVLVEGDDLSEPIADAVRGTLDGHVTLSRKLSEQGHWPAVDVLASVSRCLTDLRSSQQLRAVRSVRRLIAAYRQSEDLIRIGAYQPGSDTAVDAAVKLLPDINRFLRQNATEHTPADQTLQQLQQLAERIPADADGVPEDSGRV